jgi:hypothetical protein
MRPARRHHFISQFYLRRFAADANAARLFVVDLDDRRSFATSTSNVALENDFHTISVPGQPPDAIEKRLSQFEAQIAPALARVIERGYVGHDEDAKSVLFFVTLLLVKNPATRKAVDGSTEELMKMVSQMEARDPKVWEARVNELIASGVFEADADFEGLRKVILTGKYAISLSPEAHMDREFKHGADLVGLVGKRNWNFCRAKAGHFITCDRPAVLMWADPSRSTPPGLAMRNTRLLVPLSSTTALNGGFELVDHLIELDAEDVAKVNGHLILNARRHVYAWDGDFAYALRHNDGIRRGYELPMDELLVRKGEARTS